MTQTTREPSLASPAAQGRRSGVVLERRDGETLLEGAYGEVDRESGRPTSPATVLQIASISKQFTPAAIFRSQDRHAVSVDDSRRAWAPDCPAD
jgi:CubicO group peptidase (beta-lactamase class C family)